MDLKMGVGKIAAQVGHGGIITIENNFFFVFYFKLFYNFLIVLGAVRKIEEFIVNTQGQESSV